MHVPPQTESAGALADRLIDLRDVLRGVELGLAVPESQAGIATRDELVGQIDDYLLPRLRQMDAPLLIVVGGSTGAGKSTLVNSLVGADVTAAGVLRPTTRAPALVCHPDDMRWFQDDRILPGLQRTTGATSATGLNLTPIENLSRGLALLDAPDIDSVVEANRNLAAQLLAAADSWLFVTTAARYADAVPWDMLHAARDRGTALSVVLNRVPPEAADEVAAHLGSMLAEQGLQGTDVLVVPETPLREGRLPAAALAPVSGWLDALSADAQAREDVVRRTLAGALDAVPPRAERVAAATEAQLAAAQELDSAAADAYAGALDEVDDSVRNGSILRGEVLARWHEVVGTGDLMRSLESRVGWVRDRVRALATGRRAPDAELRVAVESGVHAVVHAAADQAAERTARTWRDRSAGRELLERDPSLDGSSPELREATEEEIRAWQRGVFDLVSAEGADKRTTARIASYGVNGAGLAVMLAVFTSTGGLTGAEFAVAGGTSAVGQRILEAIFGDQAVRALAEQARKDLLERVERLLAAEAARFTGLVEPLAPAAADLEALRDAVDSLQRAR
jgi:hypothetical protein